MLTLKTVFAAVIAAPMIGILPPAQTGQDEKPALDPIVVGESITPEQHAAWAAHKKKAGTCPACLTQKFPLDD